MRRLARAIDGLDEPAVEKIAQDQQEDPFQVLIATMLSAQTKDAVTAAASGRLFSVARTPPAMLKLTARQIEKLIYPVSFYRTKAVHVKQTCAQIMTRFSGRVPSTMEELLTLPGVGRKTANLVLILAHRSVDNICVDTHVHRIAWGGQPRERRLRPSTRCTRHRGRSGGRSSTCTWSPGARTCAGRCIPCAISACLRISVRSSGW
jgi:endonuclease III